MRTHWILRGIFFGIAAIAGVFLLGFVVMHLWNWLIPSIFAGASAITYVQAFGILILSRILFGGWKHRGGGCHGNRGYWRHRFKGHWGAMSEEEREKIRKSCGTNYCEPEEKK